MRDEDSCVACMIIWWKMFIIIQESRLRDVSIFTTALTDRTWHNWYRRSLKLSALNWWATISHYSDSFLRYLWFLRARIARSRSSLSLSLWWFQARVMVWGSPFAWVRTAVDDNRYRATVARFSAFTLRGNKEGSKQQTGPERSFQRVPRRTMAQLGLQASWRLAKSRRWRRRSLDPRSFVAVAS